MIINNTYVVKRTDIIELLDDVDTFVSNFTTFKEKHPSYSYTINISKENEKWLANVNINKNETKKIKVT